MSTEYKVYVGDLPHRIEKDDLHGAFRKFGKIRDVMISHSREYGFVEFYEQDHADQAIDEMDGYKILGGALKVRPANPRKESRSSGGRRMEACYNCGRLGHYSRDCYGHSRGGGRDRDRYDRRDRDRYDDRYDRRRRYDHHRRSRSPRSRSRSYDRRSRSYSR